jgi:hypothetical protein
MKHNFGIMFIQQIRVEMGYNASTVVVMSHRRRLYRNTVAWAYYSANLSLGNLRTEIWNSTLGVRRGADNLNRKKKEK